MKNKKCLSCGAIGKEHQFSVNSSGKIYCPACGSGKVKNRFYPIKQRIVDCVLISLVFLSLAVGAYFILCEFVSFVCVFINVACIFIIMFEEVPEQDSKGYPINNCNVICDDKPRQGTGCDWMC